MAKKETSPKTMKTLPCGRSKETAVRLPHPKQFEEWKEQLRAYLVANGLKFTEQRWKIVELILSTGGHLDAQALVEQVKKRHSEIGAATVYRSIKVLCDAQILRESLTDVSGRVIYEFADGAHHDHIVCLDCGEIFEFYDLKMESLQSAAVEKMNFKEVKHRHVIYANCLHKSR